MQFSNIQTSALKKKLLAACLQKLEAKRQGAEQAMQQAQDTANEQRGSMGDKYETFRAQMQADRDMYARQLADARDMIATLGKIDPEQLKNSVSLGAVVITGSKHFFISTGVGAIQVDGETYMAISAGSPVFQVMAGKKEGEAFLWQGEEERIEHIS